MGTVYINLPMDERSLVMLFFALEVEVEPKRIPFLEGLGSLDWIGSPAIAGGTITILFRLETGAGGVKG